ncbi:MAG: acyltransferase family protein [Bacteroidia bacterium]
MNGLRFFAALAVIITHVELIKQMMGCKGLWDKSKLVFELGGLGVVFFFVLSGFLITYLLLKEKSQTGTISVRKFYLRRLLRIWPLYYFIVFLGFLVLPHVGLMEIPFAKMNLEKNYGLNFALYMLMLPNLAFAMFGAVPHIGQAWSIGVEEQFYIIWPLIVKFSNHILRALFIVIGLLITVKVIVLLLCHQYPGHHLLLVIKPFLAMTKMESMAIGGIGAWFLFKDEKIRVLYSNALLGLAFALILLLLYFTPDRIQDGIYLVYSVLFLIIIVNVSCNPACFLKLENKVFRLLGTISYGLYMYHMIVIALVVGVLKRLHFTVDNSMLSQLMVYGFSILLTIGVAWTSYAYFEKWFLKLKIKFTIVRSGTL